MHSIGSIWMRRKRTEAQINGYKKIIILSKIREILKKYKIT